jgi:hypothetical protein
MSHFDSMSKSAINLAISQGISFITHKAGGDSSGGDPKLAAWWDLVKDLDPNEVVLGTYWIPRPDLHPDAASTVNNWFTTIDGRCSGWRDREHILQIDAERWPAGNQTKPTRSYLQIMADRLISKVSKLMPICYASKGQYGDSLQGLSIPLWNANYPSEAQMGFRAAYAHAGGDSGPGWQRYSGKVPSIWQYTSKATIGGETTCDANAFKGTLDELKALVAPGWKKDNVATLDKDDLAAIFKTVWKTDGQGAPAGSLNPDGTPNTNWTPESFLHNTYAEAKTGRLSDQSSVSLLKTLAALPNVDETKLAADLATALVPHLPTSPLSAQEVAQAILAMIQIKSA